MLMQINDAPDKYGYYAPSTSGAPLPQIQNSIADNRFSIHGHRGKLIPRTPYRAYHRLIYNKRRAAAFLSSLRTRLQMHHRCALIWRLYLSLKNSKQIIPYTPRKPNPTASRPLKVCMHSVQYMLRLKRVQTGQWKLTFTQKQHTLLLLFLSLHKHWFI